MICITDREEACLLDDVVQCRDFPVRDGLLPLLPLLLLRRRRRPCLVRRPMIDQSYHRVSPVSRSRVRNVSMPLSPPPDTKQSQTPHAPLQVVLMPSVTPHHHLRSSASAGQRLGGRRPLHLRDEAQCAAAGPSVAGAAMALPRSCSCCDRGAPHPRTLSKQVTMMTASVARSTASGACFWVVQ